MALANVNATSWTAVEPASRMWYPLIEIVFQFRQLPIAVGEDVGHDPERWARRVDVGPARHVFLEDVVLDRAGQDPLIDALFPSDGDVQGQQDDGRRVDGHGRGDLAERDPGKQLFHIREGIDGHADPADLPLGQGVVRVVPHLGREVEGDAQAADALVQQVVIAPVGLGRGAKTGVLAHGPEPSPVHRRLDAAGKRETAREFVH